MWSRRLLLLLGWLALGCVTPGHAQTKDSKTPAEPVITLARGPDYWGLVAPVYTLRIYADGAVIYTGEKNVKTFGVARGRVSERELRRLFSEFEKVNYFSLRDRYDERGGCPLYLADGPVVHTGVLLNGRWKSVTHDSGCFRDAETFAPFPEGLSRLEDLIDEVADSGQWVK